MPIANLRPFLEDARKNKYCLGCFNVFNVETQEGAVEAAINLQTPVVCTVYEPQLKYSKRTKQVVDIVHSVGLMAEVEVGYITRVGQDEGNAEANLTNVKMAVEFVEKTGVGILAPAIGSIHELTKQKAALNLELLKQIRQMTDCFL